MAVFLKLSTNFRSYSLSDRHLLNIGHWVFEEFDKDILLRADGSKVSHSIHIAQVWVSVPITICYKKKLSLWRLNDTL